MSVSNIRVRFWMHAGLVRKSVTVGALTVEEGKAKLHEILDDLIDDDIEMMTESFKRSARESAKRELDKYMELFNE